MTTRAKRPAARKPAEKVTTWVAYSDALAELSKVPTDARVREWMQPIWDLVSELKDVGTRSYRAEFAESRGVDWYEY